MWNKEQIRKFWQENEAEFAGDTNYQEIVRLCKKYIKGKVLDVGAGSGALIRQISDAIVVDLVVLGNTDMIQGNIASLPFSDESFDTILACEILEHLDDDDLKGGLKEVHRCLKRRGHFIMTVPNNEDLKQSLVTCPECGTKFHRRLHQQSFDKSRVRELLENNAFQVVKISLEPLGFMGLHRWTKYLRFWIIKFGLLTPTNIIAIGKRD